MPLTGYQLPSPRAIEPPSGEYGLAAKSANPDAFLYSYRNARQLAQGDYDKELQLQHVFALQQQALQAHDEQQKNAISLLKEPGGGSFLASGNPLGMSLGGSPGAMTNLAQAGDTAQGAKNFQATMTGLNQGSQGGYQLAPGSAVPPGLPPGLQLTNLSPAMVQAANINAASRVAAASIGAGGKGPKDTLGFALPTIPVQGGGEITPTMSTSGVRTQADADAARARAIAAAAATQANRSGNGATSLGPNPALPPAQQDTGSATGDNTPLGQVTSAPGVAKPAATTPASKPAYNVIDTNSPNGRQAQNEAKRQLDTLTQQSVNNPAAKLIADDVRGGMQGNAFTIIQRQDGNFYVVGKQHYYPLNRGQ